MPRKSDPTKDKVVKNVWITEPRIRPDPHPVVYEDPHPVVFDESREGGTEDHPWRALGGDFYPLPEVKLKLDDIEERLKRLEWRPLRWRSTKQVLDKLVEILSGLVLGAVLTTILIVVIMWGIRTVNEYALQVLQ